MKEWHPCPARDTYFCAFRCLGWAIRQLGRAIADTLIPADRKGEAK